MTSPAPARLPIPGGRQMTVKLLHDGQPAVVVLGFKGAGSWTGAGVAEKVLKAFWDSFRPATSNEVTCVGGIWRDVSVAEGPVYEAGPYTATTSAIASPQTVAAACVLIRWSTAQGGRSGKGRTFLPGLPALYLGNDGRSYAAELPPIVATAISTYLAHPSLTEAGVTPAVLSFRKGAAYEITGGNLASVVGIQRRRMR